LRTANNGADILDHISTNFDINIEIVSGEREAQLIFQGVSQVANLDYNSSIIIDIGGGSVEFIQVTDGKVTQLVSIPIGIARLYKLFHLSEPITPDQIAKIYAHLKVKTETLFSSLPIDTRVIGSAGTFNSKTGSISRQKFNQFYEHVVSLDLEQRKNSDLIPVERAKYIVAALILVKFLFEALDCTEIVVSPYALKEGLILDF